MQILILNTRRMKKTVPFKVNETGYHKSAKEILATWVNGLVEYEFYLDGSILFIPDVTCFKDGILDSIYEVVYSHPLTGRKLGMIQYWCYRNSKDLSVFEVSADFILAQTVKPERIEGEYYSINL